MEIYNQEGVDALATAGKPIPGQSLTADPEQRRPFESSPEFTNFKEALDFTVGELLLEENLIPMLKAIGDGMPITEIVMQMGYVGFREGKWNPDLMLMMIEPLMYVLMSLAEKAGLEYRIDDEDDDEEDIDEKENMLEEKTKNIARVAKEKLNKSSGVPQGDLPTDIVKEIAEVEINQENLLDKPMEETPMEEASMEEAPMEEESLLSRGQ